MTQIPVIVRRHRGIKSLVIAFVTLAGSTNPQECATYSPDDGRSWAEVDRLMKRTEPVEHNEALGLLTKYRANMESLGLLTAKSTLLVMARDRPEKTKLVRMQAITESKHTQSE